MTRMDDASSVLTALRQSGIGSDLDEGAVLTSRSLLTERNAAELAKAAAPGIELCDGGGVAAAKGDATDSGSEGYEIDDSSLPEVVLGQCPLASSESSCSTSDAALGVVRFRAPMRPLPPTPPRSRASVIEVRQGVTKIQIGASYVPRSSDVAYSSVTPASSCACGDDQCDSGSIAEPYYEVIRCKQSGDSPSQRPKKESSPADSGKASSSPAGDSARDSCTWSPSTRSPTADFYASVSRVAAAQVPPPPPPRRMLRQSRDYTSRGATAVRPCTLPLSLSLPRVSASATGHRTPSPPPLPERPSLRRGSGAMAAAVSEQFLPRGRPASTLLDRSACACYSQRSAASQCDLLNDRLTTGYSAVTNLLDAMLDAADYLEVLRPNLKGEPDVDSLDHFYRLIENLVDIVDESGATDAIPYRDLCKVRSGLDVCRSAQRCGRRQRSSPVNAWDPRLVGELFDSVYNLLEQALCHLATLAASFLMGTDVESVVAGEESEAVCRYTGALNHLAAVAAFSPALCTTGCMRRVLSLLQQPPSSPERQCAALRCLSALCSSSKGCVRLLSLGGLDAVMAAVTRPDAAKSGVACEAAGVLAQLANLAHPLSAAPKSLTAVVSKLIELCSECDKTEAALLYTSALASIAVKHASACDELYRQNAVRHLCERIDHDAFQCTFVREQISIVLLRMSARGYEIALIGQHAVPRLLHMLLDACQPAGGDRGSVLVVGDSELHKTRARLAQNCALCLSGLSKSGPGLRAVHLSSGAAVCSRVAGGKHVQPLVSGVCNDILSQLQTHYGLATEV